MWQVCVVNILLYTAVAAVSSLEVATSLMQVSGGCRIIKIPQRVSHPVQKLSSCMYLPLPYCFSMLALMQNVCKHLYWFG